MAKAPSQHHQTHALLRAGSPVKLLNTPLVSNLVKSWSLDHLVTFITLSLKKTPSCNLLTHAISSLVMHAAGWADDTGPSMDCVLQRPEAQHIH